MLLNVLKIHLHFCVDATKLRYFIGTPAFMAPELLDRNKRPFKITEAQMKSADVWSFGNYIFFSFFRLLYNQIF